MPTSPTLDLLLARLDDVPEPGGAHVSAAPAGRRRNNTHIHLPPNFSAFDSVEQAVGLAASEGVGLLGVSNYYDYSVYTEFAGRALAANIAPLFGTEIICLIGDLVRDGVRINDPANPGKMYICGKGISRFDPIGTEAAGLLQTIRDKDSARMADMVARMGEVLREAGFAAELDEDMVKSMVVARHGCRPDTVYLQERHVAQAFQERLAERLSPERQVDVLTRAYGAPPKADPEKAVPTQNEMRSMLMKAGKPGYVAETFVDYEHAVRLILALGGIPCYPTLADGVSPACGFEETPDSLIGRLQERGIVCAEFIPDRNTPEVLEQYATSMRDAGIVVTAGTEHNTRDLIPIEPACKGGTPIPEVVAEAFWEGACVVVAHMCRVATGHGGFVDAKGQPDPAFSSASARIAAYRAVGEAIVGMLVGPA